MGRDFPQVGNTTPCPDHYDLKFGIRFPATTQKKCRQGIRGKFGQTTVAPIKAWRGSLAEPPRPLTAPRDKTSGSGFANHFIDARSKTAPICLPWCDPCLPCPRPQTMNPPLLRLVAVAFALLSGLLRAEVSNAYFLTALEQGQRQKIVVYGTSLTANAAWPAELQETLRASYGNKLRIINAAGGGKDSRWGLANLSNRVLAQRPDTVFIEFSINDALEQSKLSVHESMSNLREMISQIRTQRPHCDVIVMVMNPPTGTALGKRSRIEAYQKGYRQVASEASCRLISFSAVWREIITRQPDRWQSYAPDGIHPNEKACREVILPYLLRKIGYTSPSESATAAL